MLPDFAARRARIASEASVWKKWPGSVERDILKLAVLVVVESKVGSQMRGVAREVGLGPIGEVAGVPHV